MEVLGEVVTTSGYFLSSVLFTIFVVGLRVFLRRNDKQLDNYMLATLALIGLSEYIQLYTRCCEHFNRPDWSLSTYIYDELIVHLIFFYAQLAYLTRLILMLLTLNGEESVARYALRTKLSVVAVGSLILVICVCAQILFFRQNHWGEFEKNKKIFEIIYLIQWMMMSFIVIAGYLTIICKLQTLFTESLEQFG